MTSTYRTKLENEMHELMNMLDVLPQGVPARFRAENRLREISETLEELDNGDNWSQAVGETQPRIVLGELAQARKVINK